jgi:hypothetical protein
MVHMIGLTALVLLAELAGVAVFTLILKGCCSLKK